MADSSLKQAQNLGDLSDKAAARANLELDKYYLNQSGDRVDGELVSYTVNNWRIAAGDYGAFWRNDGSNYYLLFTNAKDQIGSWNNLRPFAADIKTGNVWFGHHVGVGGDITLKSDARRHIIFKNANESVRMYLYKDKGGDGVRLNNGADGGGDYVFHKNGNFYAPKALAAGGASLHPDGNIYGTLWGGWLSNYLNSRGLQDIRLGAVESSPTWYGPGYSDAAGYVITGVHNSDGGQHIETIYRRPLQKLINGSWYTVVSI
nr:hypothetical protein [Serratia microhaemolytica]